MQVEFGCSHPFVSALLLKLRAEDRAAGIDDYDVGAAVNGQIDKRDRYCHAHMVIQDTTPRQYCSGRGKLEGWFYGQFQETLGAWQMFCLFEAAPNATRTVPLSLERGSVFLLPGSAEPAVLVAILVGSKPVGGKESGRRQAVYMGLLRESVSGAWVYATFPSLLTPPLMSVSFQLACQLQQAITGPAPMQPPGMDCPNLNFAGRFEDRPELASGFQIASVETAIRLAVKPTRKRPFPAPSLLPPLLPPQPVISHAPLALLHQHSLTELAMQCLLASPP